MLEDVIKKFGGYEVNPMEAYTDIFKLGQGYIQKANDSTVLKANPIAYYKVHNSDETGHFKIMFEDKFEEIYNDVLCKAEFAVLNGITYFGRKNLSKHSSKMYAMIFDLDGVDDHKLLNFLNGAIEIDYYPLPNYMALSGHGVHLYYVFEEPVNLYPYLRIQLKELKYALIDRIWNMYTSNIKKPQKQGIYQPFRVLGGMAKPDAPLKKGKVFRINEHPFSLSQLCEYVPEEKRLDTSKLDDERRMSVDEARIAYPEWYERIVVRKESRKYWTCKPDLYNWWKRKIFEGAVPGHRYFCVMALAIYAAKSGISDEQLKKDALEFVPFLNGLDPVHPFTEEDVDSALECFDERYKTFPRNDIEKITSIQIPATKRNGRSQKQHIKVMSAIRDIEHPNGSWREGNGRKDKKEIVQDWKISHPNGKKIDCIRDTGLSKPTVYKWW